MRLLREVKGQHQRFSSRILDFDAAAIKCGLGQESNFGVKFPQLHILVITHFESSNPAAPTICME